MSFRDLLELSRSLGRRRPYAALDVLGVTLGIAAFVVLILVTRYQDGFDLRSSDTASVIQVDSIDPSPTDYARAGSGMLVVGSVRAGLRNEILNRCTIVFLHHEA